MGKISLLLDFHTTTTMKCIPIVATLTVLLLPLLTECVPLDQSSLYSSSTTYEEEDAVSSTPFYYKAEDLQSSAPDFDEEFSSVAFDLSSVSVKPLSSSDFLQEGDMLDGLVAQLAASLLNQIDDASISDRNDFETASIEESVLQSEEIKPSEIFLLTNESSFYIQTSKVEEKPISSEIKSSGSSSIPAIITQFRPSDLRLKPLPSTSLAIEHVQINDDIIASSFFDAVLLHPTPSILLLQTGDIVALPIVKEKVQSSEILTSVPSKATPSSSFVSLNIESSVTAESFSFASVESSISNPSSSLTSVSFSSKTLNQDSVLSSSQVSPTTQVSVPSSSQVPFSSQGSIPALSQHFVPIPIQIDIPTSSKVSSVNQASILPLSQNFVPIQIQLSIPTSSQVPSSSQVSVPAPSQSSAPIINQILIPTASQVSILSSSQVSSLSQVSIPVSSQTIVPAPSQISVPSSSQGSIPSSSHVSITASNQVSTPSLNQVSVASSNTIVVPFSSLISGSTLSPTFVPILSSFTNKLDSQTIKPSIVSFKPTFSNKPVLLNSEISVLLSSIVNTLRPSNTPILHPTFTSSYLKSETSVFRSSISTTFLPSEKSILRSSTLTSQFLPSSSVFNYAQIRPTQVISSSVTLPSSPAIDLEQIQSQFEKVSELLNIKDLSFTRSNVTDATVDRIIQGLMDIIRPLNISNNQHHLPSEPQVPFPLSALFNRPNDDVEQTPPQEVSYLPPNLPVQITSQIENTIVPSKPVAIKTTIPSIDVPVISKIHAVLSSQVEFLKTPVLSSDLLFKEVSTSGRQPPQTFLNHFASLLANPTPTLMPNVIKPTAVPIQNFVRPAATNKPINTTPFVRPAFVRLTPKPPTTTPEPEIFGFGEARPIILDLSDVKQNSHENSRLPPSNFSSQALNVGSNPVHIISKPQAPSHHLHQNHLVVNFVPPSPINTFPLESSVESDDFGFNIIRPTLHSALNDISATLLNPLLTTQSFVFIRPTPSSSNAHRQTIFHTKVTFSESSPHNDDPPSQAEEPQTITTTTSRPTVPSTSSTTKRTSTTITTRRSSTRPTSTTRRHSIFGTTRRRRRPTTTATSTTRRRPFRRPTTVKRPILKPAHDDGQLATTSPKPNRPAQNLLAFGLSMLPAAAVAAIIGFPLVMAGRKKRETPNDTSEELMNEWMRIKRYIDQFASK